MTGVCYNSLLWVCTLKKTPNWIEWWEFCLGRKGWPRSELAPMTNVCYNSFLRRCTLNPISSSNIVVNYGKLHVKDPLLLTKKCSGFHLRFISRSSQSSTTDITKTVVCAIVLVGWCILKTLSVNLKAWPLWRQRASSKWSFTICRTLYNRKIKCVECVVQFPTYLPTYYFRLQ